MALRAKPGHLNERVYCKPIDRTLKMLFIEGSGSFLRPTIPELWKLLIKTVSFPYQEKLLKEAVLSLAISVNANTKNSQIKHCPCPKYVAI